MRRPASLVVALALAPLFPAAALARRFDPPLEGQRPPGFDPAPPRGAQPPRPQAGAPKSAMLPWPRWVITRNVSRLSAWVSLSRGPDVLEAGCIGPHEEYWFTLDDVPEPITLKATFTRDRACAPPRTCMGSTEISVFELNRRDIQAVVGGGPGCGLRVAARPEGLKRGGGGSRPQTCCLVRNSTSHPMWVTVYEGIARGIARTACIQPGRRDWVSAGQLAWMRAEVTMNANCARPVGCDTTMEVSGNFWTGDRLRGVVLRPDNWAKGGGCWWQFEDSYPRR